MSSRKRQPARRDEPDWGFDISESDQSHAAMRDAVESGRAVVAISAGKPPSTDEAVWFVVDRESLPKMQDAVLLLARMAAESQLSLAGISGGRGTVEIELDGTTQIKIKASPPNGG